MQALSGALPDRPKSGGKVGGDEEARIAVMDMQIELHSRTCSCRGGSWVVVDGRSGSPCTAAAEEGSRLVLGMAQWKSMGKPSSVEEHAEAESRAKDGDRREFNRYAVAIKVRLSRLATWRKDGAQFEDTTTEVVAKGGALVNSHMAVEKGEILQFEVSGTFSAKAEVMYVSGGKGVLRLGLRFLDNLLPDRLIPPGAEPLP